MTYTMPSLDDLAAMTVEPLPDKAFDLAFDEEGCLSSYWVLVDAKTGAKEKIFTAKGRTDHDAYMHSTKLQSTKVEPQRLCWHTFFEGPHYIV